MHRDTVLKSTLLGSLLLEHYRGHSHKIRWLQCLISNKVLGDRCPLGGLLLIKMPLCYNCSFFPPETILQLGKCEYYKAVCIIARPN